MQPLDPVDQPLDAPICGRIFERPSAHGQVRCLRARSLGRSSTDSREVEPQSLRWSGTMLLVYAIGVWDAEPQSPRCVGARNPRLDGGDMASSDRRARCANRISQGICHLLTSSPQHAAGGIPGGAPSVCALHRALPCTTVARAGSARTLHTRRTRAARSPEKSTPPSCKACERRQGGAPPTAFRQGSPRRRKLMKAARFPPTKSFRRPRFSVAEQKNDVGRIFKRRASCWISPPDPAKISLQATRACSISANSGHAPSIRCFANGGREFPSIARQLGQPHRSSRIGEARAPLPSLVDGTGRITRGVGVVCVPTPLPCAASPARRSLRAWSYRRGPRRSLPVRAASDA